jgi:hypothetical protein
MLRSLPGVVDVTVKPNTEQEALGCETAGARVPGLHGDRCLPPDGDVIAVATDGQRRSEELQAGSMIRPRGVAAELGEFGALLTGAAARAATGQLIETDPGNVVDTGTMSTTHVLHRLCRVAAGRSRSQPVRSAAKCLL